MSAPFLTPEALNNWTKCSERSISSVLYDALTGTDQSAYARLSETLPNEAAKSIMAPMSTRAAVSLRRPGPSSLRAVHADADRPYAMPACREGRHSER